MAPRLWSAIILLALQRECCRFVGIRTPNQKLEYRVLSTLILNLICFTIPNFQMVQSLYDSENSSVYRAIRQLDQKPVILKCLKADYPTATQLARYQHEYELLSHFNLPGVIRAYSLEQWRDQLILVLEEVSGESLNHWLTQRPLTVTQCLSLAIQIADSLGTIAEF